MAKWGKPTTPRAKGIKHNGINMKINDMLDAKHEQEQNKEDEKHEQEQNKEAEQEKE